MLENEDAASTFGAASEAPYLAHTLTAQGMTLPNYFAVTHHSLGNYIAMISGQALQPGHRRPTARSSPTSPPARSARTGRRSARAASIPPPCQTVANQLTAKGLSWKGYMEDMGNTPAQPATCRHPAIGAATAPSRAKVGDQYAARHNPFVYFHSLIDGPLCAQRDVPLDRLPGDLASSATTPAYSFVTPNLCDDGHDSPCVNGRPGGLKSADVFLRAWIPRITASPAYKQGGLVIVTFDEAEGSGADADSSACCDQQPGPNTPSPGGTTPGPGGGRIGAVLLSPYVKPGTVSTTPYNHYALLRTTEDLFGLGHLGYAARSTLRSFGPDVFNGPGPAKADRTKPRVRFTGLPRRCARRAFRVRVRVREGSKLRRGGFFRDSRRLRSTRQQALPGAGARVPAARRAPSPEGGGRGRVGQPPGGHPPLPPLRLTTGSGRSRP